MNVVDAVVVELADSIDAGVERAMSLLARCLGVMLILSLSLLTLPPAHAPASSLCR